jgi:hypothetical protein
MRTTFTQPVRSICFHQRVTTHADGAVGIQISQPIGRLAVCRGIETFGGTGPSLVKGVVISLSAMGLSIKPAVRRARSRSTAASKTIGAGVVQPVPDSTNSDDLARFALGFGYG